MVGQHAGVGNREAQVALVFHTFGGAVEVVSGVAAEDDILERRRVRHVGRGDVRLPKVAHKDAVGFEFRHRESPFSKFVQCLGDIVVLHQVLVFESLLREAFAIYRQFPIAVLLGRHRRNAQIGDAVYHQLLSVARQIVDSECNSHYNEFFLPYFLSG